MTVAVIDWRTRDTYWSGTTAQQQVTLDDGGGPQSLLIDERSVSEAFDAITAWGASTFGGSWSWTWSDEGVVTITAGVAVSATWGSVLQDRLGMPSSHSSGSSLAGSSRPPAFFTPGADGAIGVRGVARERVTGDAGGDGAVLSGSHGTQSRTMTVEATISTDDWAALEGEAREAAVVRVAHVYDPIDDVWYTCALGEIRIRDVDGVIAVAEWEVVTDA